MKKDYKICTRCIMDTSDAEIQFDENGVCNHCRRAEYLMKMPPYSLSIEDKRMEWGKLTNKIKEEGKGKKYDCIVGVSGGVDSTFVLYKAVKAGLRPLAVHLDNGWDADIAISNMKNVVEKLGVDYFNFDCTGPEYTDLQVAFLLASTPDAEIPTDHALAEFLYKMARNNQVKYILTGTNLATESILPRTWSHGHGDWKYIKSVYKIHGKGELKTFMHRTLIGNYIDTKIRNIRWVHTLNYFDYVKKDAMKTIQKECGWKDYGGKHYESVYTRFVQAYILPVKFGYDKRRAHASSLVIAGQMTRQQALDSVKGDPYPTKEMLKRDTKQVLNKLGLSSSEFKKIMEMPPKSFWDYPSYETSAFWNFVQSAYYKIYRKKKK